MSADPIVYCLERLTDYAQFERLATDVMARTDFADIEPLGGTADGGRDALHVHRDGGTVRAFAYSVRSDWEAKLREDCTRIAAGKHQVHVVVFVSTRAMTVQKRENLRTEIRKAHGWDTEFYDIERLRSLLAGPLRALIGQHPSIFVPPWFERRGGEVVSHDVRNLIVIDHLAGDHAFAAWLFSRLSAAGYSVWCRGLAPLAGEDPHASIIAIVRQRAARYLPVLSTRSVDDSDLRSRTAVAAMDEGRVVPCWLDDLTAIAFDSATSKLVPARFDLGWKQGLATLTQQLEVGAVPQPLEPGTGRRIALGAYQAEPLVRQQSERVYANVFSVHVPLSVLVHRLSSPHDELDPALARRWAHVQRGDLVFSFAAMPADVPGPKVSEYDWQAYPYRFAVKSADLVKMLVKRSLFVACHGAGFEWCDERHTFFLNESRQVRHQYQDLDGRDTHISLTGERSFGSRERRSKFRFQLGPVFRVAVDEDNAVSVRVAFYVRLTDHEGKLLDVKLIPSRRKRVTKNWWNRQWLQRTVGVMQLIAGHTGIDGQIAVGEGKQAVNVDVKPLSWDCPVSIDVEALDRVGDFQEELAAAHEMGEEEPDEALAGDHDG